MGKLLVGLIGLVVGAGIGVLVLAPVVGGAAAGIGIATGLSAGVCSTIQAAQAEGLLDAAQVDQVLNRAAADMSELAGTSASGEMVGGLDDCSAVMDQLRDAQQ